MRNSSTGFQSLQLAFIAIIAVGGSSLCAEEPNEIFEDATIVSPGVLSVADHLSPAVYPDTLLGARAQIGNNVYKYDDDSSPIGDGYASALFDISTNSGTISFAVTGTGDDFFEGDHSEFGMYEVFVDARDSGGTIVDSFSEVRTLQPGMVDDFTFTDGSGQWIGGTYDAYIDNTLGGVSGDIDFFTFTGLTPGAPFTAETADPNTNGIDTLLGWFDSSGSLLASDDDSAGGALSLLQGIVPNDGMLTFAVTGYSDDEFDGNHFEDGDYELNLSLGTPGDFDRDGDVDGNDFLVWQRNPTLGNLADWQANYLGFAPAGDFDVDGDVDGHDFLVWQRNLSIGSLTDWMTQYGMGVGPSSIPVSIAVPEPISILQLAVGCSLIFWRPFRIVDENA